MKKMIRPIFEGFQAKEGLEATGGAVIRAKCEGDRGGIRSHFAQRAAPRGDEQSNLGDTDSRLMRKGKRHEYRESYHAQAWWMPGAHS